MKKINEIVNDLKGEKTIRNEIDFGYPKLNEKLSFVNSPAVITIVDGILMDKVKLLSNLLLNASKNKSNILIISDENKHYEMTRGFISVEAQIPYLKIKHNIFSIEQKERYDNALNVLNKLNIFFEDINDYANIEDKIENFFKHFNAITPNNTSRIVLCDMSNADIDPLFLRGLAYKYKLLIINIVDAKLNSNKKINGKLCLSSLDSDLNVFSDCIINLNKNNNINDLELIITKNNNGSLAAFNIEFLKESMKIKNMYELNYYDVIYDSDLPF